MSRQFILAAAPPLLSLWEVMLQKIYDGIFFGGKGWGLFGFQCHQVSVPHPHPHPHSRATLGYHNGR